MKPERVPYFIELPEMNILYDKNPRTLNKIIGAIKKRCNIQKHQPLTINHLSTDMGISVEELSNKILEGRRSNGN